MVGMGEKRISNNSAYKMIHEKGTANKLVNKNNVGN